MWRRLVGAERRNGTAEPIAQPEPAHDDHQLERFVDVHTFDPGTLRNLTVNAGFVDVRIGGEELLANAYGWLLRALEAGSDPIPRAAGVASVCVPQLPRPAVARRKRCWSRGCPQASSTTCCCPRGSRHSPTNREATLASMAEGLLDDFPLFPPLPIVLLPTRSSRFTSSRSVKRP